jgi:PhnB protein
MKMHTYLNYGGNCQEAFRFYEKHLGGKITPSGPEFSRPVGEMGAHRAAS